MDPSQIPLPDQIPDPVEIPASLTDTGRSSTVEALIAQNEDLMARLSVTLRRNLILEENLEELERNLKESHENYERVFDQNLILMRKDEIWQKKLKAESARIAPLKDEIQLFKLKVDESETFLKSNTEKFRRKLEQCHRSLSRFRKYHLKIQKIVRPKIKLQNQLLRQISDSKNRISDMQATITRLTDHLQSQRTEFQQAFKNVESQYQFQIQKITEEMEAYKNECLDNRKLQERIDALMMERGELENRSIALSRKYDSLYAATNRDIEHLQGQVAFYRTESKKNESELSSLRCNVERLEQEKDSFQTRSEELSEHLESLQILWQEKQKESEQIGLQKSALQKLNLELTMELRRFRETGCVEPVKVKMQSNSESHQTLSKLISEIETGY